MLFQILFWAYFFISQVNKARFTTYNKCYKKKQHSPSVNCCWSHIQVQLYFPEPVSRVHKAFSSEGSKKRCNRPEFKWVQGPGCVRSQIWSSIVQSLLFSLSNRTLSFSHCCLLQPLYHSVSFYTLCMYTHRLHTLFSSFSFSSCCSHPHPASPLFPQTPLPISQN